MTNLVHTDSYGIALIAEERQRQVDVEGFTPEHDARHRDQDLVAAAVAYAVWAPAPRDSLADADAMRTWPWSPATFKPDEDRRRNLIRAGALLAAELDRIRVVEVDRIRTAVASDTHAPASGNPDRCGSCDRDWHDDRCSAWCEGDPAGWCGDCLSAAA